MVLSFEKVGKSLGIDLVPHKICTTIASIARSQKRQSGPLQKGYVPVKEVLKEVKAFLAEKISFDHFSLSGRRPTLHSRIRPLIEGLKKCPRCRWLLLQRVPPLDEDGAGRPSPGRCVLPRWMGYPRKPSRRSIGRTKISLLKRSLRGWWNQKVLPGDRSGWKSCFAGGQRCSEELQKMKKAVERIQPDLIHLNTVVRPLPKNGRPH